MLVEGTFCFLTFLPILPPSYFSSPMYPSLSPQTMSHAAYVHDIQHVIVDNLQFMLGSNYQVHDRYTVQNQAIAEFRKFASAKNIHVSVVIHPRKVRYMCGCGGRGVWMRRGVERRGVDEDGCGGRGVWRRRGVEEEECGGAGVINKVIGTSLRNPYTSETALGTCMCRLLTC